MQHSARVSTLVPCAYGRGRAGAERSYALRRPPQCGCLHNAPRGDGSFALVFYIYGCALPRGGAARARG